MLRDRREAMGVGLAEAEAATRIRQKYLAALEADEWHLLPGEVVGRGFLRNYATFLGLEPNEAVDRRRSGADAGLTSVLSPTSAGSNLPPIRQVDYRPKEVDLREEADGMETRELRLAPILSVLGALTLLALLWFAWTPISNMATAAAAGVQGLLARAPTPVATPTLFATPVAVVNPDNTGAADTGSQAPAAPVGAVESDTLNTPTAVSQPEAPAADALILIPTATPLETEPEAAAVTESPPLPTPTETPNVPTPEATPLEPTAEPTPTEVVVVAAACPDPRSLISSPGVNQTLSGVVPIIGSANHDALQYYKLEYAPGANAGGGFVYFDGGSQGVVNGTLGALNTTVLPNGLYTLQVIVVDQTGNFPPPCLVTVDIRN